MDHVFGARAGSTQLQAVDQPVITKKKTEASQAPTILKTQLNLVILYIKLKPTEQGVRIYLWFPRPWPELAKKPLKS